jgi:diguanylate cyclase (GGDEF)-like protein
MARSVDPQTYDHLDGTPGKEGARLAELKRSALLDSPPEPEFDRIVRLVTSALGVPMAAVTLIDRDRQWFKASIGLKSSETPRSESFCSHVVALDDTLVVPDARTDMRFNDNPSVIGDPYVRFYLGVPLRTASGLTLGSLCAIDNVSREASERDISILSGLADLVVEQIELRLSANTDGLTGAMQRRAFLAEAARDFARARRRDGPFACLLLDVDHFKAINDRFGHAAGDAALRHTVQVCREALRESDYVGRLGGEEFCVALPEATCNDGVEVGERIRRRVAEHPAAAAGSLIGLTLSIGVAGIRPDDATVSAVIERADQAMYEAKRAGRNRTLAAD